MDPDFLRILGYKVETRLSAIKRTVSTNEFDAQALKRTLSPIAALESSLRDLREPLETKQADNLPNPFQIGYRYAEQGLDPTIAEIWNDIAAEPEKESITGWRSAWAEGAPNTELRAKVTSEISQYIENIAIGYKIFSAIPPLERKLAIIERSREFFVSQEKQTKDFDRLIELVDLVKTCGFTLDDTVAQIVKGRELVEAMKADLDQTATPDRKRTIEDRIETINAKINDDKYSTSSIKSAYQDGYWMAIRGEDKTIFDLADAAFQHTYSGLEIRTNVFHRENPVVALSQLVSAVLEGYAAAYHLAFLEKQLKTESALADKADSPAGETPITPKLKWKGQKNQLYEVVRKLKEKGLLAGSYEDLAVFIKAHVEGFTDTALSTILKQMGRPQNLPKDRRIDLDPEK